MRIDITESELDLLTDIIVEQEAFSDTKDEKQMLYSIKVALQRARRGLEATRREQNND